jgi:myosin heavy chain 6/7
MVDMNDPEVIESLKFLMVPKEEKIKTCAKPFDGKKNVFIRDAKEGFVDAIIQSEDATKGTVTCKNAKGDVVTVKKEEVEQMNPPKYEKCDDMADLTYLNDATVLHNLRARYVSWYIYVIKKIKFIFFLKNMEIN